MLQGIVEMSKNDGAQSPIDYYRDHDGPCPGIPKEQDLNVNDLVIVSRGAGFNFLERRSSAAR